MIRAVFLDLYNTICYFHPSREERQQAACRAHGLEVSITAIQRAYVTGEEYWTQQNAQQAVARLPEDERQAFYTEYERFLLHQAGLEVSPELAREIYNHYTKSARSLRLYADVLPVLAGLRGRGLQVGIISNNDRAVEPICEDLLLSPHLHLALSSHIFGCEKPDPRIFQAALDGLQVSGAEAVHVGDQYHSDIVGALAAGIHPILIDRSGLVGAFPGIPRITDLWQLDAVLCTLP